MTKLRTTHAGSLPRPADLTEMLTARDHGEVVEGIDERVAAAVGELVRWQLDAGLSVVNDGEASKINYSTYVTDRLEGFGGPSEPGHRLRPDLREFPDFFARMPTADLARPACIGRVRSRALASVQADIANLQAALAATNADDAFMTAASPGVIESYLQNRYYTSHEEYIWALADAMKPEYDGSTRPASYYSSTAPTSLTPSSPNGSKPISLPSITVRAISHRSECACTSAGATTRARTTTTCRSRT